MRIAYLIESTKLWGGIKVVFMQALYLSLRGIDVVIICNEPYPEWMLSKLKYLQKNPFDENISNEYDLIITAGFHITSFHSNIKNQSKQIHLCQGYEGALKEAIPFLDEIETVYKKDIPKIVISETLSDFLKQKFNIHNIFNIGQGLEKQYFYTNEKHKNLVNNEVINLFLFGPFQSDVKQIKVGIESFKKASKIIPNLRLIRVSIFNDKKDENLEGLNYEYYINLNPQEIGELLRKKSGLLLAPSKEGEGFGLPPLEAMACGLPVVMTKISSFMSFDKLQDYAEFVEPENTDDMAKGILEVINNDSKRKQLIKRGMEVASQYSYEKVADNLEKVLTKIHNDNKQFI